MNPEDNPWKKFKSNKYEKAFADVFMERLR